MMLQPTKTRASLANDIWRACDILRRDNNCGGIMEYIEHLAWLLFLRFLDAQEDEWAMMAQLEGKPYQRILEGDLRWSAWARKDWKADELLPFIHGQLIPYLRQLSGSPIRETISGIFSERTVIVAASPYNLKDVLKIIDQIDFHNQDDIFTVSQVYEDLLQKLGNENRMAGEFYTPRPVIRFIIQVLDPQIGETVYDPACGSSGFLVEAHEWMRQAERSVQDHETLQRHTFFGQEKKAVPALLGLINLVLHGVTAPNIYRRNTLEEDTHHGVSARFDVIPTNPPFGGTENRQIQRNFRVQANATELLFLQHIMKKLKPRHGARCGMVVPEGTLFRGGAFATVKQELLEQFNVHTVVSLPPGTFAPYSDVKTALLFFERPGPTHETWYYELPLPEELKKFSKGSPVQDEDFAKARQMWEQWRAYLKGNTKRPFKLAQDLKEQWRVYSIWQPYHNAEKGKIKRPEPLPTDGPVALAAHAAEGPLPTGPRNSWVETIEDLKARNYDLTARNPNPNENERLPHPVELTTRLLENTRELRSIIENLHEMLANGSSLNGSK